MAERVKGITIEFRGNTTSLQQAIRKVNSEIKSTQSELKSINTALKFNPGSVDLWRQKQEVLKSRIKQTKQDLDDLKNAQKQMDASGVDKNSEDYRKLQREIIETESKLKTFNKQLKEIGNANLKALSEQFKSIGDKVTSIGKDLSMKVTAPLVAIGAVSAKSFAEVDKTMQLTYKTMGATKEEADMLNAAMKEAAANSTYGMSDAATATLNYARAGLTAKEAAEALAPAMNLAAGEGGDLDTVSAGLVATINGFHGSFDEAASYADVFANACNNSALDVNSLSESMSIAAPIFSAAGYTVQDAALFLGVMADNGIDANKAATSLKTGLARLVSPAKAGAEAMDDLGFSVTNSDGTMKSSIQIQKELHDKFKELSEAEQIAAASAIFGKNQMAPWLALINTAPKDVGNLNDALGVNGTTTEMATAMMSGFGGSLEKLKSSVDVAKTSLGEALAPAILLVANGIQKLVDWFNALSPKAKSAIAMVGVAVAAIGPALIVIGKMATGIGALLKIVNFATGAMGALAGGAGIGALAGPIGIAIVAIGAIIGAIKLWKAHGEDIKKFFSKFAGYIKDIWNSIKESISNAIDRIGQIWDGLVDTIRGAAETLWDWLTWPFTNAWNMIESVVTWIRNLFPIHLGDLFSGIKLPHFNIEWSSIEFGDFKIDYPSGFDIEWYKKGGIFSSPSLIGVGEAGSEAVVPLDKFWDKLDNIAAASSAPVINIYATPGMDVNALARKVEEVLVKQQKQRTTAYGGV